MRILIARFLTGVNQRMAKHERNRLLGLELQAAIKRCDDADAALAWSLAHSRDLADKLQAGRELVSARLEFNRVFELAKQARNT